MTTFVLNLAACIDALDRCENTEDDEVGGEPAGAVLDEVARQLREAGAPDAPLEEQIRAMLSSHLAMQRAGEEMPGGKAVDAATGHVLTSNEIASVLDLFRPIVARLTQQRAAARAARDLAVLKLADDVAHLTDERDEARVERERSQGLAAEQTSMMLRHRDLRLEAEKAAQDLRQRAERAERELEEAHGLIDGGREEIESLRARIAELEASREPVADESRLRTRAHVALLDWLALATGTRDGYDSRIVDMMTSLKSRTSVEPGADVVGTLRQVFVDAWGKHFREHGATDLAELEGIRAVLAHLAAMGEKMKPLARVAADWNARDCTYHVWLDFGTTDDNPKVWQGLSRAKADELAARINERTFAPVLGALRAENADLKAENAKAADLAADRLLAAADALKRAQAAEAEVERQRQRAERAEFERGAMAQRDATHQREFKDANKQVEDHARRETEATNRAKALEAELERRVVEEREACREVARSIYQGNTEIPVKDAAAWYACAEFIDNEIGGRG